MIERIRGEVISRGDNKVTIMMGGVGIGVFVPANVIVTLDEKYVDLFTHLVVRETELSLYGFGTAIEREVFETLIKVSGVGPRLALSILSTLTIDHLRDAVLREKPEVLTHVPGIGKKSASKIILELKGKVGWKPGLDAIPSIASHVDEDVLATLTALGYSIVEAQSAIQAIPHNAPEDVEERVRLALEYFT